MVDAQPPEQEPLDDVYRRLSPFGTERTSGPPAPPPRLAGTVPARSDATQPSSRGRRPGGARAAVIVGVVVLALVVAGGVSVGAVTLSTARAAAFAAPTTASSPSPTPTPTGVPGWTDYPGTAWLSSATILAQQSKQDAMAHSAAFLSAYRAALTADLGMVWTQTYPEYQEHSDNGYGGQGMVWDRDSAQWQGVIAHPPTDVRARVRDVFQKIAPRFGYSGAYLENAGYSGDAATAKAQYGATTVAKQPMWRLIGTEDTGYAMSSVLDPSLPRDVSFTGNEWFQLGQVPAGDAVVTVSTIDNSLLDAGDRAAFAHALAGFDESAKPPPPQ